MTALLDVAVAADAGVSDVPDIRVAGGADIRRALRAQIARLEAQLPPGAGRRDSGARLLSVGELEWIRDDIVQRIRERQFTGGEEQDRRRRLREEMLLAPAAHFGMTVSNAEV